jgi:Helix-turn-helix domain
MSLRASNWAKAAAKGLGLSSFAKMILRELADRHNMDLGCFPSQARLAADTEISRSQVNVLLNVLEKKKLIRRKKVWDEYTKHQKPTRYMLAFEDGFVPLPDAGDPADTQQSPDVQSDGRCPEIGQEIEVETVSDLQCDPCPIESAIRVRLRVLAVPA